MAKFSIDDLTMDEIDEIETLSNAPIDSMSTDGSMKGKPLKALALIIGRRNDPNLTWQSIGKMTLAEAQAIIESVDDTDPKA
jgi:hypothetical protein